jgi:hypothetical protein
MPLSAKSPNASRKPRDLLVDQAITESAVADAASNSKISPDVGVRGFCQKPANLTNITCDAKKTEIRVLKKNLKLQGVNFDEFGPFDVVYIGRGGNGYRTDKKEHRGYLWYRSIIEKMKPAFVMLHRKKDKMKLSRWIVDKVREFGGRFLQKDKDTGRYNDLGDCVAQMRTSMALRDQRHWKTLQKACAGETNNDDARTFLQNLTIENVLDDCQINWREPRPTFASLTQRQGQSSCTILPQTMLPQQKKAELAPSAPASLLQQIPFSMTTSETPAFGALGGTSRSVAGVFHKSAMQLPPYGTMPPRQGLDAATSVFRLDVPSLGFATTTPSVSSLPGCLFRAAAGSSQGFGIEKSTGDEAICVDREAMLLQQQRLMRREIENQAMIRQGRILEHQHREREIQQKFLMQREMVRQSIQEELIIQGEIERQLLQRNIEQQRSVMLQNRHGVGMLEDQYLQAMRDQQARGLMFREQCLAMDEKKRKHESFENTDNNEVSAEPAQKRKERKKHKKKKKEKKRNKHVDKDRDTVMESKLGVEEDSDSDNDIIV